MGVPSKVRPHGDTAPRGGCCLEKTKGEAGERSLARDPGAIRAIRKWRKIEAHGTRRLAS